MWTINQLGMATWSDCDSRWVMDARGGKDGIGLLAHDSDRHAISLSPVDQDWLPEAAEQFVRGDQWHLDYPQGDGHYAMQVVLRPIETTVDLLVLEVMISIRTNLLDSHPKVDIEVDCQTIDSIVPTDQSRADRFGDDQVSRAGSAPISVAASTGHCCSVLLGPHDRPFTTNHSTDTTLRLRLFGEFLEKGVIRRGRPWLVIDRSGQRTAENRLEQLWQSLCSSPVPLT